MIAAVLRWLWPPGAPPLRQIPEASARAAVFGAVSGLPLSFLLTPASGWRYFWLDPWEWVLRSTAIGVTFSVSFYLACGLPVSYLLRSTLGRSTKRPWPIVWATAIIGATLGGLTAMLVLEMMRGFVAHPLPPRLAIAAGLFAAILTVVLSRWHAMQAEKELAAARALNSTLRAQINPHFFFNTLSTIASLIRSDPDAAEHTLGLMADMSRYAFASSAAGLVPLERELDFARTYLEIEKARFGDHLSWTLPDPRMVQGLTIPALTVQPLVENAVRHGVSPRLDGGAVAVSVHRSHEHFELTVRNPADDTESVAAFVTPGHALWNVRERLRLTYDGRASLEVSSPEPGTVSAVIRAPAPS
jgi:hypothetical protein